MIRDKILLVILVAPFFLVITSCNPVSEDVSDPTWNSLHNSRPFQSEFFHGADYRFPVNACNEPQCHGTSLTGGNSGAPSCYTCHDNQWTVFGVSHTRVAGGYYHRYNVDDYASETSTNTNWFSSCKATGCHGATLDGNTGYNYRHSCKGCHTGISGTIPPPGHSKSKEGSNWHHYAYDSADPEGGNNTECAGNACHGSDGRSTGTAPDGTGGLGVAAHGPSCTSSGCHD